MKYLRGMTMQLTSPAFDNLGPIPEQYAFKGKNKNPPLIISQVSERIASLAIIMHDPDGWKGDFLHWMIWNIPAHTTEILEGAVPDGAIVGLNDKGVQGYMRPAPLSGTGIHRYIFELYALDTFLDEPYDANRATIEATIAAHTIEKISLTGLHDR
jgi:Raf kinase inhibitor-like YbhB/YbcL family protein